MSFFADIEYIEEKLLPEAREAADIRRLRKQLQEAQAWDASTWADVENEG